MTSDQVLEIFWLWLVPIGVLCGAAAASRLVDEHMTTDQALDVLRVHLRQEYFQGAYIEAETIRLLVDEIERLRRELALTRIVQQGEQ